MVARSRNRADVVIKIGRYKSWPTFPWINTTHNNGWWQETSDEIGDFHEDNPFLSKKTDEYYPTLTGTNGIYTLENKSVNWRPVPTSPISLYGGSLSQWDLDQLASSLLAKSNPNVSHFSLATFVGELKDWIPDSSSLKNIKANWNWAQTLKTIPQALRETGHKMIQQGSRGYVSYRFAVKPFLNDLDTVAELQKAFLRKLKQLTALRDNKELRRNMTLASDEQSSLSDPFSVESGQLFSQAVKLRNASMKTWGSVAWKVDPAFVFPDQTERDILGLTAMDRLAIDLTTGMNGYEAIKTVWNLCPWSWLVDWFADVGGLIDACNNRVPVKPTRICIMRKLSLKDTYTVVQTQPWITWNGDYWARVVIKERYLAANPIIPLNVALPIFDGSKWSILGALFGSKRKHRFT